MTIYQVVYYNKMGEHVASFGYYVDRLDAEMRAFKVRMKTSLESGDISIEEVFVHESSEGKTSKEKENESIKKNKLKERRYDLKIR